MRRLAALSLLAIVSLVACPWPAMAAGPHDGAYDVVETNATQVVLERYYVVVIESGQNFGFVMLHFDGTWTYGIGTQTTPTSAQGTLFLSNGTSFGSFSLTLTDAVLSGQLRADDRTNTIAGVKFF